MRNLLNSKAFTAVVAVIAVAACGTGEQGDVATAGSAAAAPAPAATPPLAPDSEVLPAPVASKAAHPAATTARRSETPGSGATTTPPVAERTAAGEGVGSSDSDGGALVRAAADSAAAEKVLKQAADAYAAVHALQADFVQRLENPLLGKTTTSRGTIYQRRPDRFLMRFSDPKGDLVVADGQNLWVYYPSVDPDQVMRRRGGTGAMDLQAQFLGDPLKRFRPQLEGTESVDGRPATVLELEPRVDTGYDRLRIWVDRQDHLVRRFEIHESSGIVRHFELSDLRVDPRLPDDLFHFEPPAGATIVDRG